MKSKALMMVCILLITTILSTTASSASVSVKEDIGVEYLDVAIERTSSAVTVYVWWKLTDNAAEYNDLVVNISIDGDTLATGIQAHNHKTIATAYTYDATRWSEKNYTSGTHTVRVDIAYLIEPSGANKNNNHMERIVTADGEWYKALADGYSFFVYGASQIANIFGFDWVTLVLVIGICLLIISLLYAFLREEYWWSLIAFLGIVLLAIIVLYQVSIIPWWIAVLAAAISYPGIILFFYIYNKE